MPAPSSAVQQNFNLTPSRENIANGPYGYQPQPQVSDEAYRTYNKLVDPEGIFGSKLSRMLYSSVLIKSDEPDPMSPFEGYKLQKLGPKDSPTPMNWSGYNEVSSGYILLASEVVSTTEFDTKEIDLQTFCVEGIMSIMDRIVCNRKEWAVRDPLLITELGMSMWFNLYSLCRRSTGGGKMLMFITGLFKFISHNRNDEMEEKKGFWKKG